MKLHPDLVGTDCAQPAHLLGSIEILPAQLLLELAQPAPVPERCLADGFLLESVVGGLFIHEDLFAQGHVAQIVEQSGQKGITSRRSEPIEQVAASIAAKAAFRPVGRGITPDMFFARETRGAVALHGQVGASAPTATHFAMACAGFA